MSTKSKSNKNASKSNSKSTAADDARRRVAEIIDSSNEADTTSTETVEAQPKAPVSPKVLFYEISNDSFNVDSIKGKQRKAILAGINLLLASGAVKVNEPVAQVSLLDGLVLTSAIADYKVRNNDVRGSIAFHLRQLAKEGIISRFEARRNAEDTGWVVVEPSTQPAE